MRPAVTATATTSKIRLLVDEVFDPNDPVLEGLRNAKFGFGVDTGLGMNTTEVLAANLANTRLRALAALKMQKFNAEQTA